MPLDLIILAQKGTHLEASDEAGFCGCWGWERLVLSRRIGKALWSTLADLKAYVEFGQKESIGKLRRGIRSQSCRTWSVCGWRVLKQLSREMIAETSTGEDLKCHHYDRKYDSIYWEIKEQPFMQRRQRARSTWSCPSSFARYLCQTWVAFCYGCQNIGFLIQ